jgi:PAS domain S-box-containing protein
VSRLVKDKTYYLVTLRDITVAESRLRAERFAHRVAARILAISADAIVTTDDNMKVTQLNNSAELLFGYSAAEVLGQPLSMLMPQRYRSQHVGHMKNFAVEDTPSRLMGERSVVAGITKSGEEIPLEASITRFSIDNHTIFSAHLRKIGNKRNETEQICPR